MTRFYLVPSRARRTGLAFASLAVAAASTLAVQAPATSVPGGDCPEAFPIDQLAPGQVVDGLTVTSGMTPESFDGEVLGSIKDGVGPGLDMIMVRLSSDAIDKAGIWAGMSGSPVYSNEAGHEGELIGAVAYGLSYGPSPVAGVTPAAAMQRLLDGGVQAVNDDNRTVPLPDKVANRLVKDDVVSAKAAGSGFKRLATPIGVSGLSGHLKKVQKRLGIKDAAFYKAGSAPAATITPEEAGIEAGGSLGASYSYGDFSTVGTGTVTMVCGEQVVGFGHPMDWQGKSTFTMHGADTVYIQEDPAWTSYKVSNPTGPVGTINNDRLAGIAGITGVAPETTTVTSEAESGNTGFYREGTTYVSMKPYLPDLAALGVVVNHQRVLDKVGEGSANMDFTITGTRANGTPFSLTRSNRVSSGWDIAYMSPEELYSTLRILQDNGFTDVDITDVYSSADLTEENRRYGVGAVEVKLGKEWSKIKQGGQISAAPGDVIKMRVTLKPKSDGLVEQTRRLEYMVPKSVKSGREGELSVQGGNSSYISKRSLNADTFAELVTALEDRPRNDQVTAQLYGRKLRNAPVTTSEAADQVISGGKWFSVYFE